MSKTTILIVEDEAIVAADLADKLGRFGYEVAGITAEGEKAVLLAGLLRPHLVLMDIRLDGQMDGIEATEAIRSLHDVPVIYLTSHSDAGTLARAKITAPFGYILKPFEERDLATQIELALYKHQADRQLREQREWLRVTLTSIGDAVIATDAMGCVTFLNPVAESLTGWKAEEAMGLPVPQVFRVVNDQTGRVLEDPVARVLREGRVVPLANHAALVTREGRAVPIEDTAAPILDQTGQVIGAVLVFHDVTEKRRAEEALQESDRRVRLKLESILSPEGDIGNLELADIIDVQAIQSLMDDFYKLARIPMSIIDLKGKLLVGVGWQDICINFHRVHPETCKHCLESDTQLSLDVLPGELKLYKCKNNMWDIVTPILVGDRHMGNLFSGQFFFDDEELDYSVFQSQARQYGFDEDDYIAALDNVPRLSRESLSRGMGFFLKLSRLISQLSYSNIKLARSLSERDALEDALRKSRDELELRVGERTAELARSNQALQDFATIASHDMQEPLRKVVSFGSRIKDRYSDSLGEEGKDYLDRMLNATNRLQSLLKSLLDYSRVTTKAEPFREVDLAEIVRDVLSDLEVRIEKTGGEVHVGNLPTVEADPSQMRQLFQNLIGNALKFHKEGEKPVIKVHTTAMNQGGIRIAVEDNGIGFDEKHLDQIFAPFQRLHGRSSQYEGTGMGLAICKKIVERHGGSITARSAPGEGTTFITTIPVSQP